MEEGLGRTRSQEEGCGRETAVLEARSCRRERGWGPVSAEARTPHQPPQFVSVTGPRRPAPQQVQTGGLGWTQTRLRRGACEPHGTAQGT